MIPKCQVDSSGNVMASVICTKDGCKFHDFITLIGWEDFISYQIAKEE